MPDIGSIIQKQKEQSHQPALNQSKQTSKETTSSNHKSNTNNNKIEQDTVELSAPAKRLLKSMREEKMKS